jgi:hypothetical protein
MSDNKFAGSKTAVEAEPADEEADPVMLAALEALCAGACHCPTHECTHARTHSIKHAHAAPHTVRLVAVAHSFVSRLALDLYLTCTARRS